ncbi:hypothetical protein [Ruegeria atlantica]|uniref:hypothetical protein n=1 Tax=Ruegeria atlantica TaxID=81569 RepID=UPI0024956F95|nr:hypothetical protein [Ruegeria atlantica]
MSITSSIRGDLIRDYTDVALMIMTGDDNARVCDVHTGTKECPNVTLFGTAHGKQVERPVSKAWLTSLIKDLIEIESSKMPLAA